METVTLLEWLFDGLLALGLLWLAWRALTCSDLIKAIVLFITFGLLMALAWVRLDAPDVALAEAAIGAGITGALLLAALARLRASETSGQGAGHGERKGGTLRCPRWLSMVVVLPVAAGLGSVVWSLPPDTGGLREQVAANLETSGASNPVTAVLLNFRGYDTLLEMIVLLLALLGSWSFGGAVVRHEVEPGGILDTLARFLTPLLILVAAYLLWSGAHAPGGAFQAGAVLGAAGVLLLLAGWRHRTGRVTLPVRLALVVGAGAFAAMAALLFVVEGQLLKYPPTQAGILILILEIAATVSIGITLTALFLGGKPRKEKESQ